MFYQVCLDILSPRVCLDILSPRVCLDILSPRVYSLLRHLPAKSRKNMLQQEVWPKRSFPPSEQWWPLVGRRVSVTGEWCGLVV